MQIFQEETIDILLRQWTEARKLSRESYQIVFHSKNKFYEKEITAKVTRQFCIEPCAQSYWYGEDRFVYEDEDGCMKTKLYIKVH